MIGIGLGMAQIGNAVIPVIADADDQGVIVGRVGGIFEICIHFFLPPLPKILPFYPIKIWA